MKKNNQEEKIDEDLVRSERRKLTKGTAKNEVININSGNNEDTANDQNQLNDSKVKPVPINSDRLKDYEFYQRVDAWSAMQEISMWVSGVLPSSARPMVQIADKDKIAKHGFDKWSFRKKVR